MNKSPHTVLMPYTREWEEKFLSEENILKGTLEEKCINIEHMGSTSVEGLSSKPIIDIVVVVDEFEPAENFHKVLKKIGYSIHSSSSERHFYRKGNPIEYHLSIAFANRGGFWVRQVVFRDYLRTHQDVRKEYEDLKKKLLKQDPTGRNSYLSGKDEFISKILELANWKEGQLFSEFLRA